MARKKKLRPIEIVMRDINRVIGDLEGVAEKLNDAQLWTWHYRDERSAAVIGLYAALTALHNFKRELAGESGAGE